MKISFFEVEGWEKRYLKKRLGDHSLRFYDDPIGMENIKEAKDADIISVFIYSKVNREVLSNLPAIKMIATRSTGFEHIDLDECKKMGITVSNVPFYGENTVAEHTFALILSLSRNIHKSYIRTLRSDFSIKGLMGFDLKGKTLGVVGAGHIGLHVIRIAKGFGMNVLAYDLKQNSFLAEILGFEYAPLETVLQQSDIISLHAPYNKYTHHMINKDNIKHIKTGAILINTSRGSLIDTDALIEAIDNKTLSGVGLDVVEGEELIREEKQLLYDPKKLQALGGLVKDHILLSKDNVVFTPHIAFYSREALERILETTAQNIIAHLSGNPLNTV